jgi:hypothetical protein
MSGSGVSHENRWISCEADTPYQYSAARDRDATNLGWLRLRSRCDQEEGMLSIIYYRPDVDQPYNMIKTHPALSMLQL